MAKVKKLSELPAQERAHYERCQRRCALLKEELAPWRGEIVLYEATMPAEDGENVRQGWRSIPVMLADIDKGAFVGWHLRLSILPTVNKVAVPINYDELRGIQARMNTRKEKIADLKHMMSLIVRIEP